MTEVVFTTTWAFLLGGVGGVVLEMLWVWAVDEPGAVEPRTGVLYLPFNPLYGVATGVGSLVLAPVAPSPVVVFVLGALVFTVLEYVASLVMERAFGAVFWDYRAHPLNLHGRICLEFSVYWGALSLALVYLVDPVVRRVSSTIPRPVGDVVALVVLALIAIATILTLAGFRRLRSRLVEGAARGSTAWDRLANRFAPADAVVAAFPRMNLSVRYIRLRHGPRARGESDHGHSPARSDAREGRRPASRR